MFTRVTPEGTSSFLFGGKKNGSSEKLRRSLFRRNRLFLTKSETVVLFILL